MSLPTSSHVNLTRTQVPNLLVFVSALNDIIRSYYRDVLDLSKIRVTEANMIAFQETVKV